jgi:hypothetical protein
MPRMMFAVSILVLLGAQSASAAGTTPPLPWLLVVKDTIREQLRKPEYVTFRRVFFASKKTDDGAFPVCGFVNFKQKLKEHANTEPFLGLQTPPQRSKARSFTHIHHGETTDRANEIATICKNYGVY